MPSEAAFCLVPILAFCYWWGGRRDKWVRRFLGTGLLVLVAWLFLPWQSALRASLCTTSYLVGTVIGYGENSVLVKWLKNRVLVFGVVGSVHASGLLILGQYVLALVLPVVFMASGAASLRWNKYEQSLNEIIIGTAIGISWAVAVRIRLPYA